MNDMTTQITVLAATIAVLCLCWTARIAAACRSQCKEFAFRAWSEACLAEKHREVAKQYAVEAAQVAVDVTKSSIETAHAYGKGMT